MNLKTIIFLLLTLCSAVIAQGRGELVTITGDSLVGSNVGGETIREIIGNVVLTQGNIRITCNNALQYLARNDAILTGNVVVTQNNLIIRAPKGSYFGDEKIAECHSGVQLEDGRVVLNAVNGNYYFNTQHALFSKNVRLRDSVTTMTGDKLDYYRDEQKAVAVGGVVINSAANTISADTVVHFRDTRISTADGNVRMDNKQNRVVVFSGHLEDYALRNYTLITEKPLLIQTDSVKSADSDTLLISSVKMEVFNDSTRKLIATDSVKMVRGTFASKNEYSEYYRDKGVILTFKKNASQPQPVLWYGNSQLTGDSVSMKLENNSLRLVESYNNAFILSANRIYPNRYDQMSGELVKLHFDTSGITHTEVNGEVLSIYYTYDGDSANGLTRSSSQKAVILFAENQVSRVNLYVSPVSEYYPENLVEGKELSFTLPAFTIRTGRPEKKDLFSIVRCR
ncbi:MAG: OstA-like protein [Bacteroidota bacterium]